MCYASGQRDKVIPHFYFQEKYLYGAGLPQELADTSDFLLKFQDLENSEMYESISTLVQNMQNDSIGNDAAYGGPFRHPSGTDMEVFKTESYASGSAQVRTV